MNADRQFHSQLSVTMLVNRMSELFPGNPLTAEESDDWAKLVWHSMKLFPDEKPWRRFLDYAKRFIASGKEPDEAWEEPLWKLTDQIAARRLMSCNPR
jgi:hypothetical protein